VPFHRTLLQPTAPRHPRPGKVMDSRACTLAGGGTSAAHSCRRQLSQVCTGFCNWQWEAHQLRTAVTDSCHRYAHGFVIGSGRHISCTQLSLTAVAGMHRVLSLAVGGTSAAHSCCAQLSQVCTGFCNPNVCMCVRVCVCGIFHFCALCLTKEYGSVHFIAVLTHS